MSDFNDLLEAQIPRLRRYARALLRDVTRADDLVQDTLVRALAKQHLWQPGSNLRAWLFTLMHNQHVNNVRQGRREETAVDFDEISSTLIATTDPTAACQLRELDRGLARLPEEQREVILRSRLFRGRESLRKLMDMDEAAGASPPQEPERRVAA